jgi:hypothetical protein
MRETTARRRAPGKKGVRHKGQVAHIDDMVGGAQQGQERKYAMLKA